MKEYCVCGHAKDKHIHSGCTQCREFGKQLIFRREYTYYAMHEFKLDKERIR